DYDCTGLFGRCSLFFFALDSPFRSRHGRLRALIPNRRIDKGMRIAGFPVLQHHGALQNAATRIAVWVCPAMNLQIDLNAFDPRPFLGAFQRLFGFFEAAAITAAAHDDRAVLLAIVIDLDAFGRGYARGMARRPMEGQMLAAEIESVA